MELRLLLVLMSLAVTLGKPQETYLPISKDFEAELEENRLISWLRNRLTGEDSRDTWTPVPKEKFRRSIQQYTNYVCEGTQNYKVQCSWDTTIHQFTYMNVLGGKWGRESHEICGTSDSFVNWCTHVVVRKLKSVCDGQFSCNINVTNGFFGNIDPCLGSSKYLNFTYECIPASETCTQNEFKCLYSKNCVPLEQTCDGVANSCGANDNSDEMYCDKIELKTTTTTTSTTTTTTPTTTTTSTTTPTTPTTTTTSTTTTTTTPTTPTTTTTTPTSTTTTPTTTTTTPTTTTTTPTATTSAPLGTCGVSYFSPDLRPVVTRIINGTEAKQNSWPWQIQLRHNNAHHCGAAVVNTKWVITASHCFQRDEDISHYTIIAGRHNKDGSDANEQERKLSKKFTHKTGIHMLDGDITLLKLDKPLRYSKYVVPICLPTSETKEDDLCYATGWGETLNTGFEDKLKQVQLPIVNRTICNAQMHGWITQNMICTWDTTGNTDTCSGDSGGPLVCNRHNNWELHGLVSFGGPECATEKYPAVYANVYHFKPWINDIMKNNS